MKGGETLAVCYCQKVVNIIDKYLLKSIAKVIVISIRRNEK